MKAGGRLAIAVYAAVAALASGGMSRANAGVHALSPWDAQIYAAAFEAAGKGDFATALAEAAKASDKSLLGHLEQRRLLSPGHKATYEELAAWLEQHGDLVGAEKIYTLAKKRQPAGAPDPKAPASRVSARNWSLLDSLEDPDADRNTNRGRQARELYYDGHVEAAYAAAVASGERWIAGLAAFRMSDFPEAVRRFESVARDADESDWLRAGAAFWAARSTIAAGAPELAPDFLRMAAAYPTTFYGLIAERQLGLEAAAAPKQTADARPGIERVAFKAERGLDLGELVRGDPRAKRAAALAQVGLIGEASVELRAALAASKTEDERRGWIALAVALDAPMAALQDGHGGRFDPADYPTPILAPRGGFTLDPALVYAIVRQESRFNPRARSHVGATGLMQLMPSTARWFADKLDREPGSLRDPAANLRLGQDYFAYLLDKSYVDQDLLRAMAAYNGGSGPLLKTLQALGDDPDPLLLIESLPYAETRNYVERVMAGYWIYRQMFGADTPSLDAIASGAKRVDARLDRSTAPGSQRAAVVNVAQALE